MPADGADTCSDTAPRVGELERVREQVLQDLPEPLLVGLDSFGRGRLDDDVEAAASSPARSAGSACRAHRRRARRSPARACTSTLPASIFDRSRMSLISASRSLPAEEIVCANFTCSSVRLPVLVVGEQLGEDQRRVERRAQLVAHVGQELALVLVRALELGGLLGERRLRVASARPSEPRAAAICSSSCELVCSSSACWFSSRACDSLERRASAPRAPRC